MTKLAYSFLKKASQNQNFGVLISLPSTNYLTVSIKAFLTFCFIAVFRTFAISSNSLRVTSLEHFFALFTRFLTTLYDRSVNMSHPKLESISIFRFSPFFLQSYIAQYCARDTKPSHSKLSSPHKLLHIAQKKDVVSSVFLG